VDKFNIIAKVIEKLASSQTKQKIENHTRYKKFPTELKSFLAKAIDSKIKFDLEVYLLLQTKIIEVVPFNLVFDKKSIGIKILKDISFTKPGTPSITLKTKDKDYYDFSNTKDFFEELKQNEKTKVAKAKLMSYFL